MQTQAKHVQFFDRAKDDAGRPVAILPGLEYTCCTAGRGYLVFGTFDGYIRALDRTFSDAITPFRAYSSYVTHLRISPISSLLLALGHDEDDDEDALIRIFILEKLDAVRDRTEPPVKIRDISCFRYLRLTAPEQMRLALNCNTSLNITFRKPTSTATAPTSTTTGAGLLMSPSVGAASAASSSTTAVTWAELKTSVSAVLLADGPGNSLILLGLTNGDLISIHGDIRRDRSVRPQHIERPAQAGGLSTGDAPPLWGLGGTPRAVTNVLEAGGVFYVVYAASLWRLSFPNDTDTNRILMMTLPFGGVGAGGGRDPHMPAMTFVGEQGAPLHCSAATEAGEVLLFSGGTICAYMSDGATWSFRLDDPVRMLTTYKKYVIVVTSASFAISGGSSSASGGGGGGAGGPLVGGILAGSTAGGGGIGLGDGRLLGVDGRAFASRFNVAIYDYQPRLYLRCASEAAVNVGHILVERGTVHVICAATSSSSDAASTTSQSRALVDSSKDTKTAAASFALYEKDNATKVELLLQKRWFSIAEALASSPAFGGAQASATFLSEIKRRQGDAHYEAQDFEQAVECYVATIGRLEASYVIRRFLDAQRVALLARYLEAVHAMGVATVDHTTLLLNCYGRMKASAKLDMFLSNSGQISGTVSGPGGAAGGAGGGGGGGGGGAGKQQGGQAGAAGAAGQLRQGAQSPQQYFQFDVPTAIRVCRQARYLRHAERLALRHELHADFVRIQLEDKDDYAQALRYICSLPHPDAERFFVIHGKALIARLPDATTDAIVRLCSGWVPSPFAPDQDGGDGTAARGGRGGPSATDQAAAIRRLRIGSGASGAVALAAIDGPSAASSVPIGASGGLPGSAISSFGMGSGGAAAGAAGVSAGAVVMAGGGGGPGLTGAGTGAPFGGSSIGGLDTPIPTVCDEGGICVGVSRPSRFIAAFVDAPRYLMRFLEAVVAKGRLDTPPYPPPNYTGTDPAPLPTIHLDLPAAEAASDGDGWDALLDLYLIPRLRSSSAPAALALPPPSDDPWAAAAAMDCAVPADHAAISTGASSGGVGGGAGGGSGGGSGSSGAGAAPSASSSSISTTGSASSSSDAAASGSSAAPESDQADLDYPLRLRKALAVLQSNAPYDHARALVVANARGFRDGVLHLLGKANLIQDILQLHMEQKDAQALLAACRLYGAKDASAWLRTLQFFAETPGCSRFVLQTLAHIDTHRLAMPLVIVRALTQESTLGVHEVAEYLEGVFMSDRKAIAAAREHCTRSEKHHTALAAEAKRLAMEPLTFSNMHCAGCRRLPTAETLSCCVFDGPNVPPDNFEFVSAAEWHDDPDDLGQNPSY